MGALLEGFPSEPHVRPDPVGSYPKRPCDKLSNLRMGSIPNLMSNVYLPIYVKLYASICETICVYRLVTQTKQIFWVMHGANTVWGKNKCLFNINQESSWLLICLSGMTAIGYFTSNTSLQIPLMEAKILDHDQQKNSSSRYI